MMYKLRIIIILFSILNLPIYILKVIIIFLLIILSLIFFIYFKNIKDKIIKDKIINDIYDNDLDKDINENIELEIYQDYKIIKDYEIDINQVIYDDYNIKINNNYHYILNNTNNNYLELQFLIFNNLSEIKKLCLNNNDNLDYYKYLNITLNNNENNILHIIDREFYRLHTYCWNIKFDECKILWITKFNIKLDKIEYPAYIYMIFEFYIGDIIYIEPVIKAFKHEKYDNEKNLYDSLEIKIIYIQNMYKFLAFKHLKIITLNYIIEKY